MGYYCRLRVGLVLFVGICVPMVRCYCMFFGFFFVDWNAQLKLVGEYNYLEKLMYEFAIMCMCYSDGTFSLCVLCVFLVRRRRKMMWQSQRQQQRRLGSGGGVRWPENQPSCGRWR